MKAIGRGHLMGELDGWRLATTENNSLGVIGKGIVAGLNMTTAGTGNATGIVIGTVTIITNGTNGGRPFSASW